MCITVHCSSRTLSDCRFSFSPGVLATASQRQSGSAGLKIWCLGTLLAIPKWSRSIWLQCNNSVCKTESHDTWQSLEYSGSVSAGLRFYLRYTRKVLSCQVFTTPQSPELSVQFTSLFTVGLLGNLGSLPNGSRYRFVFVKLRALATTLGGREERD